jgi:hypothetical protein
MKYQASNAGSKYCAKIGYVTKCYSVVNYMKLLCQEFNNTFLNLT